MSENLKHATKMIEQGHVRIGPELVKDPAFLVTRNLEDFVTWVDSSKIRQHVLEYNGEVKIIKSGLMDTRSIISIIYLCSITSNSDNISLLLIINIFQKKFVQRCGNRLILFSESALPLKSDYY